jgi:lysophospholipid acyltransferase (LPLAT)-like uncharacterized protein
MSETGDRLYSFADLGTYPFKKRIIIRFLGLFLFLLIRVIGRTMKFEVVGGENLVEGKPVVFCFWHNQIPASTYFWRDRGIVVMSSLSFDSEYIARFIQRFGFGAARGSSTRGGKAALIQMIRAVRGGKSAAFTVDGPKGPIYIAKPGACLLAAKSNAPLLPFSIRLDRYWKLPSWDGIQIPKPFSRGVVRMGVPIFVDDTEESQAEKLAELQETLTKLGES